MAKELQQLIDYDTFIVVEDGKPMPHGYKRILYHMVFDVKMDFTRKARLVAGGHKTDPPTTLTYSSVVLSGGFDGVSFPPGGAPRIPNGTDTNAVADWLRNDFDLFGIPRADRVDAIGKHQTALYERKLTMEFQMVV